jgi:hypothetical protein
VDNRVAKPEELLEVLNSLSRGFQAGERLSPQGGQLTIRLRLGTAVAELNSDLPLVFAAIAAILTALRLFW